MAVLEGKARDVAAGIRRRATTAGLATQKRKKADDCARYLTNKAPYLDYPTALAAGWPIATGVIEGACRHLVKDRMDITGARWSVAGAEAVLKLRTVRCNGDFDAYWRWHLAQERRRVHKSRYATGLFPSPRSPSRRDGETAGWAAGFRLGSPSVGAFEVLGEGESVRRWGYRLGSGG